jgi:ABC-type nitrate/sulfonate/bicarbonate transport system permease component
MTVVVPAAVAAPARARRPRGVVLGRVAGRLVLRWGLVVLLVAVWQRLTRSGEHLYFPPPSVIWATVRDNWFGGPAGHLWLSGYVTHELLPSVGRVFAGWAVAAVVGIAVGIAIGRSGRAMDYLAPVLHFLRAVPPPTLLPVILVLIHSDNLQLVGLIVFGVVWPVLLNSADGARSVHATGRDTARVFRISRPRWLLRVVLPAAAPKIFSGLRLSLSLALILMVLGEYTSASSGIGFQLQVDQSEFDMPSLWALVVLLGVLGYVCNSALLAVQRRTLAWQPATQSGA